MGRVFFYLFFLLTPSLWGIDYGLLTRYLQDNPFDYQLKATAIQGKTPNAEVLVCCHGYGGDEQFAIRLHAEGWIPHHTVGFRFPDYGPLALLRSSHSTSIGSIHELLPFLYILKCIVIDANVSKIHLHGFSAGGGALVNSLCVLTLYRFPEHLQKIGIGLAEREKILSAVQEGLVILECPLKSLEEIIADRGPTEKFEIVRERFAKNQLRPIDSLAQLSGLKLNVLLFFQQPDEILTNRDDGLFIMRMKAANAAGQTQVMLGNEGGHMHHHPSIWKTAAEIPCFNCKNK